MVFAGVDYYPFGGAEDLFGTFSTLDEAERSLDSVETSGMSQWAHVLDCEEGPEGTVVSRWSRDYQEPWELRT